MTTDNQQQEGEGQAAPGLEHLAAQAEELEAGAAPPGQQAPDPAQAAADLAAELLQALELIRMVAAPAMQWWPDFAKVWNDQALARIAAAGAAVMDRHGISMGELFSQWGPYIALAGATIPPALVTYQAHRLRTIDAVT